MYARQMGFEFAGATDVGRKRDHNEDSLLVLPEHHLAVVCDGMGGHEAGEVASGIGVETVKKFFDIANDALSLGLVWLYHLRAIAEINLVAVVMWRVVTGGDDDSGIRVQISNGEGKFRC